VRAEHFVRMTKQVADIVFGHHAFDPMRGCFALRNRLNVQRVQNDILSGSKTRQISLRISGLSSAMRTRLTTDSTHTPTLNCQVNSRTDSCYEAAKNRLGRLKVSDNTRMLVGRINWHLLLRPG
jgi:hypothetical protein